MLMRGAACAGRSAAAADSLPSATVGLSIPLSTFIRSPVPFPGGAPRLLPEAPRARCGGCRCPGAPHSGTRPLLEWRGDAPIAIR